MVKEERPCSTSLLLVCMAFLGVGVLTALAFLCLGPRFLFRQAEPLQVGVILRAGQYNDAILAAVEAAIADINHSIDSASAAMQVKPPMIEKTIVRPQTNEDFHRGFESLYSNGIRIFYGGCDDDMKLLVTLCQSCTFISSEATSSHLQKNVALTDFPDEIQAEAYLRLINDSNPTGKVLYVVPVVLRQDEALLKLIQKLVRGFPTLKLTSPVFHQASEYPRSDALQLVSDIGARLGLVPNAQVFFASSDASALPDVLDTARVSRALTRRRWFARGLAKVEEQLNDGQKRRDLTRKVSLTTLEFLADGDNEAAVALKTQGAKHLFEEEKFNNLNLGLRLYRATLAYETVMMMHRAFTTSQYKGGASMLDYWADESYYSVKNNLRHSGLMVSAVFIGGANASHAPTGEWAAERLISVAPEAPTMTLKPIRTHPLRRAELARLAHLNRRTCASAGDKVTVQLPASVHTPIARYTLQLATMPEFVAFPVHSGIEVTIHCGREGEGGVIYACLPARFDVGDLTCVTAAYGPNEDLRRKRQLATGKTLALPVRGELLREPRSVKEKSSDRSMLDRVSRVFSNSMPTWRALAPQVLACTSSLSGCDFCIYFLATYNVSASPAACIGGCSLGTFGSCTGLVGESIRHSFELFEDW